MKSALPKVLHADLRAGRSSTIGGAGGARRRVRRGRRRRRPRARAGRGVPRAARSRRPRADGRAGAAARDRRRGAGGARRRSRADAERVLVFYGDVPLLAADDAARPSRRRSTTETRADARRSRRAWSTTRPATGASCATRRATSSQIREHRDLRDRRGARDRARSTPASTRRRVAFLREALAHADAEQRAGRALPDRHRRPSRRDAGKRVVDGAARARTCSPASTIARSSRRSSEAMQRAHRAAVARSRASTVRDGRAHRGRASTLEPDAIDRERARSCAATTHVGARRARRRRAAC